MLIASTIYLVFLIIIFIFLLTFVYAIVRAAPWVPTRKSDVQRFLKLAEIKPGQKFYDLGCGDGRLVRIAGKAGADAVGFEVSLFPYFLAKLKGLFFKGRGSQKIKYKDFWWANLRDADVVYFWLMPKIHNKLRPKLEQELKPGAKVISYVWPVEGWEPTKIDTAPNMPKLYLYQR